MASVNQTRPHCVNQMGKTYSKPLAARHGRGTALARHAMCESAFNGSKYKLCWGIRFLTRGAIRLEVIPHYRFRVFNMVKITQNTKRLDNISLFKSALNEGVY